MITLQQRSPFMVPDVSISVRRNEVPPIRHVTVILVWLLLVMVGLVGSATASPASPTTLMWEFAIGSGPREFGLASPTEGPRAGPPALLGDANGAWVLDAVNLRLIRLDNAGTLVKSLPLPPDRYGDAISDAQGKVIMLGEETRTVYRLTDSGIVSMFKIPEGPELPMQLDLLALGTDSLLIGDYATRSIFRFDFSGNLRVAGPLATTLTLAPGPGARWSCLALGPEGAYNRLLAGTFPDRLKELIISGPGFEGARLLGFLPDGRAVVLGCASVSPLVLELFLVAPNGTQTSIETFLDGFLFARRYGTLTGSVLWLMTSPLDGSRIVIRRYQFADSGTSAPTEPDSP